MKIFLLTLSCVLLSFIVVMAEDREQPFSLQWESWQHLPPAPGQTEQPGVAGAFIGVHDNALLIAGGANFPGGPIWEGGQKEYHDHIYILQKQENSYSWIENKTFTLPHPMGYGLSIPTDRGVFCLGGMNEARYFDEVFLMQWDQEAQEIKLESWPALPIPLANMSGGKMGETIYVAGSPEGSNEKYFWSLDLDQPELGWKTLPSWKGAARTHAIGVVQNDGERECFYLMKGRYRRQDGISDLFRDVHRYDPAKGSWELLETTSAGGQDFTISATTAIPVGANHILVLGGANGEMLNTLEKLDVLLKSSRDSSRQRQLIQQRDSLLVRHPGFSRSIYAYHTITHTWTEIGTFPSGSQVTTTALQWDNRLVIPSGEIAPSVRTPTILAGQFQNMPKFSTLNYAVLGLYLLLLVGLGIYLSRNQQTTEDFFKGGNRIPWWAAGISIFGTQLSAITFMAIPAKTFATNWLYLTLNMTIIMVAPFIVRYFLPFFRRFNLTSAYEYLEWRFNLTTRLLGSVMYVLLQLGRIGIVLLLPSLALSVVTGIDVFTCILSMGALSILYTVLGGIEAVIWTDVLQVVVLLGGAILCLGILGFELEVSDVTRYVGQFDKMQAFDFNFDLSEPTFWVVLIGGLATSIVTYGSDQTVIQRYLTTKDERTAAKGIMTGAWMAIPATLIFFSLGTLLFVYYKVHPEQLNPSLSNTDGIFPWYIINSLPDGISGLLIAAVFAASMSSLDSSMNSVSTVITTDFYRRFRPKMTERKYLSMARWLTVLIGVLGTLLALMMASQGISSLWDQFNLVIGLFAGGLGGIFCLGIFVKNANGSGAIVGLLASAVIQYLVKTFTDVHFLLYAFTGLASAILMGTLASMFFNTKEEEVRQFTWTGLSRGRAGDK